MRKMLVLGGTGIVGKPLAELARAEYEVHIIAKDEGLGVVSGVNLVKADRNSKSFQDTLSELTNRVVGWDEVVDVCAYNVDDARVVYNSVRGRADHIFVLSTTLVYDRPKISFIPLSEDRPLARVSTQGAYTDGKVELENFWNNNEMKATILRPYHILGEGSLLGCLPFHNRDSSLGWRILSNEEIELCDGGRMPLNVVHPKDIGLVILALADNHSGSLKEQYNVVNPQEVLARDYYKEVARQLGKELRVKEVPGEKAWDPPTGWSLTTFPHLYDVSRLYDRLGITGVPRISLQDCVRDALKSGASSYLTLEEIPVHRNMNKKPSPKEHQDYC